jgi:hypothetical protein
MSESFLLGHKSHELFSEQEFEDLQAEHRFQDPSKIRREVNIQYGLYLMFSGVTGPLPKKETKRKLSSVSVNSRRLLAALDMHSIHQKRLSQRAGLRFSDLNDILSALAAGAEELSEAIVNDKSGRPRLKRNRFIQMLIAMYEDDTGLRATEFSYNPASEEEHQYKGKAFLFVQACLQKAGLFVTDDAIAHVIKDAARRAREN